MSGPDDAMRELVEDYALGQLDGAELLAFERALGESAELQQEVAAAREALTALAFSSPVAPSPATRERVMARIAGEPGSARPAPTPMLPFPERRSPATAWLTVGLAAACLVIVKLAFDLRTARTTAALAQAAIGADGQLLAQRDSLLAELLDPTTRQVTMAAQGPARPAMTVYLSRTRRTATVAASSLETPPDGQAYQLWFIVDGKPVPSVTFRPDSSGHALVRNVPMPAGAVAATAITREPVGGSPAPTSPVLFVGKPATE